MSKISTPISNDFCPQTMFVYGTRNEDGTANFGLFNWFSYCWDTELGVMACIGGEKRTKENIHRSHVFSANLVTEKLLPLADYFGSTHGHDPEKMNISVKTESGRVLDVPFLSDSPVVFELEAVKFLPLDDGEVMLCKIRNMLMDEELLDKNASPAQKLEKIRPIHMTCETYFGWDGTRLGAWHEPQKTIARK